MKDSRLFLSLRVKDRRLFLSFCHKDSRTLLTFCFQDSLSSLTLSFHLFLHGILDRGRRNDVLKLNTVDLDSPWICSFIKGSSHSGIDYLTGCQCLIQLHITDDVTKCGSGKILDRHDRILNAICIKLRICNLEKYYSVDLHGYVIFCDHRLRWEIHNLLFQVHSSCNTLNKRNLEMDTCSPCSLVSTKSFQYHCVGLRYDTDAGCQYPQNKNNDYKQNNNSTHNFSPPC